MFVDGCKRVDGSGSSRALHAHTHTGTHTESYSTSLFRSIVKRRLMHPEKQKEWKRESERERDPNRQRPAFIANIWLEGLLLTSHPPFLSPSLPPLSVAKGKRSEQIVTLWSTPRYMALFTFQKEQRSGPCMWCQSYCCWETEEWMWIRFVKHYEIVTVIDRPVGAKDPTYVCVLRG